MEAQSIEGFYQPTDTHQCLHVSCVMTGPEDTAVSKAALMELTFYLERKITDMRHTDKMTSVRKKAMKKNNRAK